MICNYSILPFNRLLYKYIFCIGSNNSEKPPKLRPKENWSKCEA